MNWLQEVQSMVHEDTQRKDVEISAITFQSLLWEGLTELRAHTKAGRTFSVLYNGTQKLGKFHEVPPVQNGGQK